MDRQFPVFSLQPQPSGLFDLCIAMTVILYTCLSLSLSLSLVCTCAIESTFRNIKKVVLASFETVLRHSVLFASLATTVNAFTDQMVNVITYELDKVAPLKRCARRPSKPIMKWLSDEAIAAKRERHRFERK